MKIIFIAILLLSIISCSEEAKKQPRQNEITKVSLGFISGMSGRFFQIEVDTSLQYKLLKVQIGEQQQNYIGKISREMWDSLNIKLDGLNYNELDTLGCVAVDGPKAGLIVFKNGTRYIGYDCFKSFPKGFNETIDWLSATQERVSLKRTKDSLSFEFPILPIPPSN